MSHGQRRRLAWAFSAFRRLRPIAESAMRRPSHCMVPALRIRSISRREAAIVPCSPTSKSVRFANRILKLATALLQKRIIVRFRCRNLPRHAAILHAVKARINDFSNRETRHRTLRHHANPPPYGEACMTVVRSRAKPQRHFVHSHSQRCMGHIHADLTDT